MSYPKVKLILNEIKTTIRSKKELEYFYIHQGRYQYILEKILSLNLKQGSRVLDVGCYPLHLFSSVKKLNFNITGISSKHESIKKKGVFSLNIEKEALPFSKHYFDLIIMSEVIEHLAVNPRIYMKKMWRVLKPNGFFLVTTPNVVNLKNRISLLFGKNIYFSMEQLFNTKPNDDSIYYRHNREFTKEEVKKIMGSAGFDIQKADFFSAYTPFRKKSKDEPTLSKIVKTIGFYITQLYPRLRDSIYIEAKKI